MKTERCKDLGEPLNVFPALLPGCTIPGAGPGQILQPLAEYVQPGAKSQQSQREMPRARAIRRFCQISGAKDVPPLSLPGSNWLVEQKLEIRILKDT